MKTTAPRITAIMTPIELPEMLAAPSNCEGVATPAAVVVIRFKTGRPVPVPRVLAWVVRLMGYGARAAGDWTTLTVTNWVVVLLRVVVEYVFSALGVAVASASETGHTVT